MEENTSTTLLPQIFECASYADLYKEIRKFDGDNAGEALNESNDSDFQRSLKKGKDLGLLKLNNGMIKMLFNLRAPRKGRKRTRELVRLQTSEPISSTSLSLVPLSSEPPQKKTRNVSYAKSSDKLFEDFIKALCREAGKSNSNIERN